MINSRLNHLTELEVQSPEESHSSREWENFRNGRSVCPFYKTVFDKRGISFVRGLSALEMLRVQILVGSNFDFKHCYHSTRSLLVVANDLHIDSCHAMFVIITTRFTL